MLIKKIMINFKKFFGWYLAFSNIGIFCPKHQFSSVQSLSRVQLFASPWITACQASLSITNSWSLLKLVSIELVMPSNHLILCHPLQIGFLSLCNIHLSFLQVISWLSSSVSFSTKQYFLWLLHLDVSVYHPFTYWRTSWLLPSFGN